MKTEVPWGDIHELLAHEEERVEEFLLTKFPDALLNEGEQIYIRKTGGRLMWIRANVRGSEQKWEELTPNLAVKRRREAGDITDEESLEMLRNKLRGEIETPELYEIGWYQDLNGHLYQFDGKTWVGRTPSKNDKKALEYLG